MPRDGEMEQANIVIEDGWLPPKERYTREMHQEHLAKIAAEAAERKKEQMRVNETQIKELREKLEPYRGLLHPDERERAWAQLMTGSRQVSDYGSQAAEDLFFNSRVREIRQPVNPT